MYLTFQNKQQEWLILMSFRDFYSKCELWVLSVGTQKLKFISKLRSLLDLSPKEAKCLIKDKEFMIKKGHDMVFNKLVEELPKIDVNLEIRYEN